jgi:hypothetical protein
MQMHMGGFKTTSTEGKLEYISVDGGGFALQHLA